MAELVISKVGFKPLSKYDHTLSVYEIQPAISCFSFKQRPDAEEKPLSGELRTSPLRASTKKQLPSIPKNAVPITKPVSPASSSQSTNGTHASYGPFYLEYCLLAEL